MVVRFHDLTFGTIAAESELESDPDLLLEGFYDPFGIRADILEGKKWLVLGPKGAGKSTVLIKIHEEASSRSDLFVLPMNLDDFPLEEVAGLDVGGDTRQLRLHTVWTYLLAVQLLASTETDLGAQSNRDKAYQNAYRTLRTAGLLPALEFKESFFRLASYDIKGKPPGMEFGAKFERATTSWPFFTATNSLRSLVTEFRSDNMHLVFVDGLDSVAISNDDETRWAILTGLITAAHRLNTTFRARDVRLRIVVLCRTDLFDSLDYADADKLSSGISHFDWFPSTAKASDNYLLDLAEKKCSVRHDPRLPLIAQYLPLDMKISGGRDVEIHQYLMNQTRYLPRDFLSLLNFIAKHSPTRGLTTKANIVSAVREYTAEYFVREARIGLLGLLAPNQTRALMSLLETLNGSRFTLAHLEQIAQEDSELQALDLRRGLRHLHRLGLIANADGSTGTMRYNFSYHRPFTRLDLGFEMTLHNALAEGLGKPRRLATR